MEPIVQKGQEQKNLDRISRSAELLSRRASMLNLYLCRIHAADLETCLLYTSSLSLT